jgi:hypothetical protein
MVGFILLFSPAASWRSEMATTGIPACWICAIIAGEDIVGVLSSWKKQLGPQFARFMPEIGQLATPGDLHFTFFPSGILAQRNGHHRDPGLLDLRDHRRRRIVGDES